MKNLLPLLFFGLLAFIGCQSETNKSSSSEASTTAKATTSPTSNPTVPAAYDAGNNSTTTEATAGDVAPELPGAGSNAPTSAKSIAANATDVVSDKMTKAEEMKEAIAEKAMEKKEMIDKMKDEASSKISAEKDNLAAAASANAAKVKEEAKRMAEEKAAAIKEKAANNTRPTSNPTQGMVDKGVEKVKEIVKEESVAAFSHQVFDDLLRKHVSSTGKVNYKGFKADKAKLDGYLKMLEGQKVESSWSNNKKLAFWINAYNAYTIDLVADNYPIGSITDLEGGKPWDKAFIKLNGKTLSLNNIENDIIRPTFKDGRIHFAVNCAAKSCPPILNKAWTESNIQSQLDKQTRSFINNSKYNTISAGSATISKIFEWYAVDFGTLTDYLAKYSKAGVTSATQISYNEYDWSLNE